MKLNKKIVSRAVSSPFHVFIIFAHRKLRIGIKNPDLVFREEYGWNFGKLKKFHIIEAIKKLGYTYKAPIIHDIPAGSHTLSISEALILGSLIKSIAPKRVLEIGTGTGFSTKLIAENMSKEGILHTVDLPINETEDLELKIKPIYFNANYLSHQKANSLLENRSEVIQHFHDSHNLSEKIGESNFDFIFIDGCHDYNYVKNDSIESLKVASDNAVVLWHDYGMLPGVSKFLDKLAKQKFQNLGLIAIQGSRFVIVKLGSTKEVSKIIDQVAEI
jgi:predicted O-methyltransferase YrrM